MPIPFSSYQNLPKIVLRSLATPKMQSTLKGALQEPPILILKGRGLP